MSEFKRGDNYLLSKKRNFGIGKIFFFLIRGSCIEGRAKQRTTGPTKQAKSKSV